TVLGLLAGHLRDLSDRVFRTREQVERLLALDCLATVPKIKVGKTKGDLSRALSTNVRKTKSSATPVATIKVSDEPHGGLPPAPNVETDDESNGEASPSPNDKVAEPNSGSSHTAEEMVGESF